MINGQKVYKWIFQGLRRCVTYSNTAAVADGGVQSRDFRNGPA